MRILYQVGSTTYWLEPEFECVTSFAIHIEGCKLYNKFGDHLGWWDYSTWPTDVREMVRREIRGHLKKEMRAERLERVHTHSMISKTK